MGKDQSVPPIRRRTGMKLHGILGVCSDSDAPIDWSGGLRDIVQLAVEVIEEAQSQVA